MERLKLNHWFVGDNKLSISFLRYHVSIRILKNDKTIFYQLEVMNSNREVLLFNFYSLEDAIIFTEQTIQKSKTLKEIVRLYQEQFKEEKFKSFQKVKNLKD